MPVINLKDELTVFLLCVFQLSSALMYDAVHVVVSAVQELNGDVGVIVSVPAGNAPSDPSARAAVDLGHGAPQRRLGAPQPARVPHTRTHELRLSHWRTARPRSSKGVAEDARSR